MSVVGSTSLSICGVFKVDVELSQGPARHKRRRHSVWRKWTCFCRCLELYGVVLSRKLQALSGNRRFRRPSPHRHTRKKVNPSPSEANNIPPTNHISTHDNDKIPPLHRPPRRQCKANRRRHIDNNRLRAQNKLHLQTTIIVLCKSVQGKCVGGCACDYAGAWKHGCVQRGL